MLFLLLLALTGGLAAKLPEGVKLCHKSDPNFQQCVAKNIGESLKLFAKGNRELGVPPLEPFYIEQLEIKGEPGQSVAITQKYRNVYLYGSTVADLTRNFRLNIEDGCSWVTDIFTPVLRMEADYEIKGQLLVFPLNSHGKSNITQFNLTNRHTMACEKYTKKNQVYIRITNYTTNMNPEKVVFEFENLFPGNEQISNEVLKTINENALSIFNDVKGGVEELFSLIYLKTANMVFSRIPLKDIFLD